MNRILTRSTWLAAALLALVALPAHAELELPRVSPGAKVTQTIATTDISMSYSRPGVKGRVIWGDLVPYDKIWRTGANEATTFKTSGDVMIAGKKLPAGTYALFTVPGRDTWSVTFNSQAEQWGAFEHDASKDALTIQVKPVAAPHQEWMEFSFENLNIKGGDLVLRWEKLALNIPVEVDIAPILADVKKAMAEVKKDDWRTPYRAASFCMDYDVAKSDGMAWVESSTKVEQNYFNTSLMARYMAAAGKTKQAIALGEKAIALGQKAERPVETTATERLVDQWKSGN
jgi:hypothetical protein